MQTITPNVWFDTDAEAAVDDYTRIFNNTTIGTTTHYDEATAAASGQPAGSVLTIGFTLEGQSFVALNGGPQFSFTPAISFMVNCPTVDEVDHLWEELSTGPDLIPLDSYPFSDRYAWIEDKYGLSWQLIHTDSISDRRIVPSLMFVGDRCGQAENAITFYTTIFDDSEVGDIMRYGPDQEPDKPGTVMFADFTLRNERFATMDSAQEHDFDFNEAISFIVSCKDQDEVDYFWNALTADGGSEGQCGWLTDKFGVSWQIVPTVFYELVQEDQAQGSTRVTEAMLQMTKLDIAELKLAMTD